MAVLLFLASAGAAWASTFYVKVTSTPSSITCTNTSSPPPGSSFFKLGLGATLSWNLISTASIVDVTVLVGSTTISTSTQTFPFTPGSQALGGGSGTTIAYTPFPYTVTTVAQPRDSDTDGVSVSFTCTSTGGTNFQVTTLPPLVPVFQASPSPVSFSATNVGATTAPIAVTIANTGTADAAGVAIANSNSTEFIVSGNTCGATIAKGASCTLNVAFKPAAGGSRGGNLSLTRSYGAGVTVAMNGTGVVSLSLPSSVTFPDQTVGTTSAPRTVSVTNTSGAAVTVSSITSSAPSEFGASSADCTTINAGATCTISLAFTPAAAGARSAAVTVTSNGIGSPQTISVSGNGTTVAAPGQLSLASSVSFGAQLVGTTSAANNVTVTNTGGTAVTISSIASSAPSEFGVSNAGCTTVNPGAGCTITLTFTPAAAGARTATITVASSGVGNPQTINVSGTGSSAAAPGQLAIGESISFGSVLVGTTSSASVVTATNIGGAAVAVASVSSSNPSEFAIASSTCGTVNAGDSCSFGVTFSPGATGARAATITVVSNGAGSPQGVSASGTGVTTPPPPPTTIELIEYRHAEWDHYFVTGIADEITKLDNGTFAGWTRTGYKFKAYPLNTAGAATVCRFFSTSFAPRSSHFYTPFAEECAIVKANPDWQFEGDVFAMPVPALDGTCPASTAPVYRLYNNGQGAAPNHRYTIDFTVRAQMIAAGWIPEGYGDLGVIMCAPL